MLTTTLGARVRAARLAIPGLTQTALSQAVGVHRVHLARVECGMRSPSARLVSRLAQALDVDPEFLAGDA